MKPEHVQKITQGLIDKLEEGTIPWEQPYSKVGPYNPTTGRNFRGGNAFLLMILGGGENQFLGFQQGKKLGGFVRAGSKGLPVVFPIMRKDKKTEEMALVNFGISYVFPRSCFTGLDESKLKILGEIRNNDPIEAVEKFVALRNPKIMPGGVPCYIPEKDEIQMPDRNLYLSSGYYYDTLLHELGHMTGAAGRMNREGIVHFDRFGTKQYGKEELVAEMFAFFARVTLGLESCAGKLRQNREAYIQSWLTTIREEPQILFSAANEAQKALDWYLGTNAIEIATDTEEVA